MKYSIQRKMFLISLLTTVMSFALVLVSFNLITHYHIEKQTKEELTRAVTLSKPCNLKVKDVIPEDAGEEDLTITLDTRDDPSAMDLPAVGIDRIARNLSASLYTEKAQMDDVGFIISDLSDASSPEMVYSSKAAGSSIATITAEDSDTSKTLYSFALDAKAETPMRTTLNDTSYYVVRADIADQTDVVFYKNIQPMEDLASEVNFVLLILLLVTGCLTVAMSMGLSRGMVQSIRKLCRFAGDIGAGDLTPKELNLKERELAVLSDEMNDMIRKLAAHDAEQKAFFQNVSHELRTPLMSIQGYAEGIAGQVFAGEELSEAAEIILAESDRLTEMVGNLLYLSRMDSPDRSLKTETFDCVEVVEQMVDRVRAHSSAKEKEITLDFVPSEQVSGDSFPAYGCREDFQRAVSSILENALRYARTRITVTVDPAMRIICIADDGPGISQEDMPHIFQRFYKGSGGLSGIGLAIAHAAVRGLSGTLTAKNSDGACFTIFLPEDGDEDGLSQG